MNATTVHVLRSIAQARVRRARAREYRAPVFSQVLSPAPEPAAAQPEQLPVYSRIVCQRWQAYCEGHYACAFDTQLAAAMVAAREAWSVLLGREVGLNEILLKTTEIPGSHQAFLKASTRRVA